MEKIEKKKNPEPAYNKDVTEWERKLKNCNQKSLDMGIGSELKMSLDELSSLVTWLRKN